MASLNARLVKLEASAPPPLPQAEPSGEAREADAVWRYLSAVVLSTMPERAARRVIAEVEAGGPRSALAERVLAMAERAMPPPWTCTLSGCECKSYYAPLALPAVVCEALDSGQAAYDHRGGIDHCIVCAYAVPYPWPDPCPLCGGEVRGSGYLVSEARYTWLDERKAALERYSRREPLTDTDRWHLDRFGYLATLAGARPPGVPAPAPVANSYGGGLHCEKLDIRHPAPERSER